MSTSPADTSCLRAQGNAWRRFSLFRRASTSSLNTLSSIKSAQSNLPQYSPFDASIPSVFPTESEWEADLLVSCPESATIPSESEQSSPAATHVESSTIPPRYSRILYQPLSLPTAGPDDGAPKKVTHVEHSFPIRGNKPWATLLTFTSSSTSGLASDGRARKIPCFVGNDMVTGMVELDLETAQRVQEISVTLRGKIVTGYLVDDAYTFLKHKHLIWNTKHMGSPPTSSKHPRTNQAKKAPGKLLGSYQIPFCFPFPSVINFDSYEAVVPDAISPFSLASPSSTTISNTSRPQWAEVDRKTPLNLHINSPLSPYGDNTGGLHDHPSTFPNSLTIQTDGCGNNDSICPAPPSFIEPGITASIQYELTVHIVHGFLKPDSRIKTAVAYTPSVLPRSPSTKRWEAYATRNIAPGPLIDPGGWIALPKVTVEGRLGGPKGRNISVSCQLYLAAPLTYTRNTFIPCHLSFSGDDTEALNVLSSPKAPCIRLVRRLRHFCPKGGDSVSECDEAGNTANNPEYGSSGTNVWYPVLPAATGPSGKGTSLKTIVADMGGAVWWKPPKDAPSELYTSHLEGEIHLPVDMQPSCACPLFRIEYFVEMRPPIVTGFESMHSQSREKAPDKTTLVSHPVRIATFYPSDGMRPIAFTQPLRRKC